MIKKQKKEARILWHKYFAPALIAGLGVGIASYFFELNSANLLMFASVAASAVMMTHKYRHHLTTLRTVVLAYITSAIVSLFIGAIGSNLGLSMSIQISLVVALVSIAIIYFNIFHPPAVSAGISFIVFNRDPNELVFLLACILVLFILIRLCVYAWHSHLSLREFMHEFTHLKLHNH